MSINPQNVDAILLDIAPEMAAVDEPKRLRLIEYAALKTNFGSGKVKELAVAYLAAHNYTMSNRGGSGGAVTSEKEGDLARSYGLTSQNNDYNATSYGMEYWLLVQTFIKKPRNRFV